MTFYDYYVVMKGIGTADFKAHLSQHLRAVREGETLTILDRRTPIAKVVPIHDGETELVVRPASGNLQDIPIPTPSNLGFDIVSLLREEREDRF